MTCYKEFVIFINQYEKVVMHMVNQKKSNSKKHNAFKRENVKATTKASVAKKATSKEKAWFSDMNQIDWFPIDPYCD